MTMFERRTDAARGVVALPAGGHEKPPITLHRLLPPPELAPFVEHAWIVRWDLRATGNETASTLPHPSIQWVTEGDASEVSGIYRGRFVRVLEGEGRVVAVRFRTAAFTAFTSEPMFRLTGRVLPATRFFPEAEGLASELARLSDDDAVERVFSILRARSPKLSVDARRAQRIADRIVADRELVSVAAVAKSFAISPLALQRLFRRTIGVSPKWILQRARIHEAMERIAGDGKRGVKTAFAALAQELGFTDQAHFTRTFGAFVGAAPRAYARRLAHPILASARGPTSKKEEAKEKKKEKRKKSE